MDRIAGCLFWGLLGLPGFRELLLIGLVVLALYGRSGLRHAPRYARLLRPWRASPRRSQAVPSGRGADLRGDRWFWFLAIVAAAAVAAWIATRALIVTTPGGTR